jgi:hypothetical protein
VGDEEAMGVNAGDGTGCGSEQNRTACVSEHQDPEYISDIPLAAEERVIVCYPDGPKQTSEYWLNGERVGLRDFHPTGELRAEVPFKGGIKHGTEYRWDDPNRLLSAEPYVGGKPHGAARQWADDGRLLGSYTMKHGTGVDLWWQEREDGSAYLAEVYFLVDGWRHGFEWWLQEDQQSVWIERHWSHGSQHGIEREWNARGRLSRGYPRYRLAGERTTKRCYLQEAARDPSLPPFRPEENEPHRMFPPEIAVHLRHPEGKTLQPAHSVIGPLAAVHGRKDRPGSGGGAGC